MLKFSTTTIPFLMVSAISISFIQQGANTSNSVPFNPSLSAPQAGKWVVDKAHSNVKFTVTHMVISEVEGSFKNFEGTVESSAPDFSDANILFSIDVASINTDNERRDNHLKSDDFFNAASFPEMKFVSTSFKPLGGNKYQLNGNLTIRDVTRPVIFDVTYGGTVTNGGQTKAGFKAKTSINRFDYNLKWNKVTEAGSLVVSKEVEIAINIELNKVG